MTTTQIIRLAIISWLFLPYIIMSLGGVDEDKVDFLQVKNVGRSGTVNYFTAGIMAQPEGAFEFILNDESLIQDRIVLVPYGNTGANFFKMKEAILEDIRSHPEIKKVRFFGISMGCNINQLMRKEALDVEVKYYDINPCYSSIFLQKTPRILLPAGSILFRVGVEALGILNLLPIYPIDGGEYISLRTLSEQLLIIGLNNEKPKINDRSNYLITSEFDEFLNNYEINTYYAAENRISVKTQHGRTATDKSMYLYAVRKLLK